MAALDPRFAMRGVLMDERSRRFPVVILIGLLLAALTLALAFVLTRIEAQRRTSALPVYGKVGDFTLTNQTGQAVSLANLRGEVWIADIIFTRCPGPCLRMTRQMKELDAALAADSRVRLVSLTTDPDFDTPSVLKLYGEKFQASDRWMFLTGTKPEIKTLAEQGLKLSAVETEAAKRESPEDLFIHSTSFVVVDKQGRLRGIYETGGEGVDWGASKTNILSAVRQLERER
jgi:protein SCO1/2